ncbi:MbeB family mobilization protein, partial [Enterobacter hormaechei]
SMNSLLTLAKDLEQKSKAQQQSTGADPQRRINPEPQLFNCGSHPKAYDIQRRHHPQQPKLFFSIKPANKRMSIINK